MAVPLSRKFGKKELGIFAAVSGAVAFLFLFFAKTSNMWLYVAVNIIGLLGFGLFNLIIWAFISDVIDDQEVRTNVREDGTIYAVCSFARKLGQAIASALGGWSLAWIGYAEGSVWIPWVWQSVCGAPIPTSWMAAVCSVSASPELWL